MTLAIELKQVAAMAEREAAAQTDALRAARCEGEAHAYRDAAARVERAVSDEQRRPTATDSVEAERVRNVLLDGVAKALLAKNERLRKALDDIARHEEAKHPTDRSHYAVSAARAALEDEGAGRESPTAVATSTGGGKTSAMLRSAYESVLRNGIDVRIVRAGKDYDVVMSREEHPQPVMSGERRIEAGGAMPDVIGEIVTWLHGLEEARENTVSVSTDAHEIAIMRARRGVYEGIADDIKRKWGSR